MFGTFVTGVRGAATELRLLRKSHRFDKTSEVWADGRATAVGRDLARLRRQNGVVATGPPEPCAEDQQKTA